LQHLIRRRIFPCLQTCIIGFFSNDLLATMLNNANDYGFSQAVKILPPVIMATLATHWRI
jgi:hypothetical protein